ncbi:hypothetical protein [Streptomyces sp. NPDC088812]|uniref:hypothetical protein n=1 Tax=Streptomyces sp. NPDC088812 TaxID=3365905 RepID=UPI00380D1A5E
MSRLGHPAGRLAAGSGALARHLGARVAAWVARGRRTDLTGWRSVLGCWARLAALGIGLYLLWRLVRAIPNLLWLMSAVWAAADWRAGRPAVEEPAQPLTEGAAGAPRGDVRDATLTWIRQQIGDRQGVHLRTLLRHAQAHGMFEGMEVTEFRSHLERWGIPVRDQQRVRGMGVTVGIRATDLDASVSPSPEPVAEEAA